MHPSRRKGASAEREIANLLSDHLGETVKRRYNLGTHEDVGDLLLTNTVIQVADWSDALRAVREKPLEAERQRLNAGVDHAWTFVRLRGGVWRAVQTPEQAMAAYREAVA